ncbi:MaoC family dehydratase N-terminal domain-containing protein [Aestuariivirga sp.]|uniref:FAS1-like dehydratase domain-containing protein n=1 Tax=Aestuariivirga sp. TaxID=2650926 RepID=UPI003593EB99
MASLVNTDMEADFNSFIGRSVTREDIATPRLLAEYRATMSPHLFESHEAGACPPGFHWGIAPATPETHDTGPDGAERKGLFLPPIPLPRRMWAGGSIETFGPIRVGQTIRKTSQVASVKERHGSTGNLFIVSISHEFSGTEGLLLRERQDLVFREASASLPPASDVPQSASGVDWTVEASPLLLFRFSAFTFNGHRIHYDTAYAAKEGYPGLLVHGPLQAALMLNLVSLKRGAVPRRFDYRCLAPLFGGGTFGVACEDHTSSTVKIIRGDGVTTAEGQVHVPET